MKLVSLMEEIIQEEIEKDTTKVKVVFFQITYKNDIYYRSKIQSLLSYQKKYGNPFYHSTSKCIRQQYVSCEHGIISLPQPKCHVQPLFNDFA